MYLAQPRVYLVQPRVYLVPWRGVAAAFPSCRAAVAPLPLARQRRQQQPGGGRGRGQPRATAPRCARKWRSREGGGAALALPLPAEQAPAGPGAARAMPTSFTVVPVEAQGEERDGRHQEEEQEEDEKERGSGESGGQRLGAAPALCVAERSGAAVRAGVACPQGAWSPCRGRRRAYLPRCKSALRERAGVRRRERPQARFALFPRAVPPAGRRKCFCGWGSRAAPGRARRGGPPLLGAAVAHAAGGAEGERADHGVSEPSGWDRPLRSSSPTVQLCLKAGSCLRSAERQGGGKARTVEGQPRLLQVFGAVLLRQPPRLGRSERSLPGAVRLAPGAAPGEQDGAWSWPTGVCPGQRLLRPHEWCVHKRRWRATAVLPAIIRLFLGKQQLVFAWAQEPATLPLSEACCSGRTKYGVGSAAGARS